jgi:hypothetical protein
VARRGVLQGVRARAGVMLASLLVQYGLFLAVAASTLSHASSDVTIETHVFNSSVTLLLAAAYVLVGAALRAMYELITARAGNRNPDIELVHAYEEALDELRDLDPEASVTDPAAESRPCAACAAAAAHEKAGAPEPAADARFYLEVYGYGLVMFTVYYTVDLVLLAPSLCLLCGLLVLSARDSLALLRSPDAFPDVVVVSKSINLISLLLVAAAVIEMFLANAHMARAHLTLSEAGAASPAYVFLAYVLPALACALLGAMRRSCSEHRQIRRAAPLAVLLALSVVLWVLGMDVVAAQRDYYHGAVAQLDADWHALVGNASLGDPSRFLGAAVEPARRPVPLLSIVLEPLLKAALAFSVITAVVNRKTTDVAAIIAVLTAAKQLHLAADPDIARHLLHSCVTAAVAALLCSLRYTPLAQRLLARAPV